MDDHSVWPGPLDVEDQEEAVATMLQKALMKVGPENVPADLRDSLSAMGVGDRPGTTSYDLHRDAAGSLDWRSILRRCIGQALQVRPTFQRPSRRFPQLVGLIPARRRQAGRAKVMAIIDTSGSMSPPILEAVSAELALMARRRDVLVVECDAAVQAIYPYRPLSSFHGGGGTDFRPPLAADFLRRHRPDVVIYFTDGMGPAPASSPSVPVIWCLTAGGQSPAPWGKAVHIG